MMELNTRGLDNITQTTVPKGSDWETATEAEGAELAKRGAAELKERLAKLVAIDTLTPVNAGGIPPTELPPFDKIWKSLEIDRPQRWEGYSQPAKWHGVRAMEKDTTTNLTTVWEVQVGAKSEADRSNPGAIESVFIMKTVGIPGERPRVNLYKTLEGVKTNKARVARGFVLSSEEKDSFPYLKIDVPGGSQLRFRYDSGRSESVRPGYGAEIRVDLALAEADLKIPKKYNTSSLYYKI